MSTAYAPLSPTLAVSRARRPSTPVRPLATATALSALLLTSAGFWTATAMIVLGHYG